MLRAKAIDRWPLPVVLSLTCVLLAWVYAPGVYGPAVFDDLIVASFIDGASASWIDAVHAIGSDASGPFGRPVAIASFVLEERLLGDGLWVSKGVNIALHCLNFLLVAWLFTRLLRDSGKTGAWVAVLAGCAWAFSPLLVSTTLYTVQRMAMLSCTFSIFTLLLYDYWRGSVDQSGVRHLCFGLAMLATAVLAVLAKENALTLPLLILLLEMAWYRFENARGVFSRQRCRWWVIAVVAIGLCGLAALAVTWSRFAATYALREFSLGERLLAEGAILWDYLGQLLWPETRRMGLYHDDAGLYFLHDASLNSWLLALSWPALLLLPALLLRWRLLARVSVCLALYFCAHLAESTVIPLELYFEHRNYLPAVFVFLAPATLLAALLRRIPVLLPPIGALLTLVLLLQLSLTSVQVQLWSSESLWRLAQLRGHPQSFRANHDMAIELATRQALPGALRYSAQASTLVKEAPLDFALRNILLDCLAGGRGETVGRLQAQESAKLTSLHTLRMLVFLVERDTCSELPVDDLALQLERLFGDPAAPDAEYPLTYFLLALLENALGHSTEALAYTQRYLEQVDNVEALLMQLHLALSLGETDVARTTRERLETLDAQALLTSRQRATLALYAE